MQSVMYCVFHLMSTFRKSKRLVQFSEKPDLVIWEPAELVPLLKEVNSSLSQISTYNVVDKNYKEKQLI